MLPSQVKAARALLDWTQTKLAEAAGLDLATVSAFERSVGNLSKDSLWRIQQALGDQGIVFYNSGNPGVRLMKSGNRDTTAS